MYKRNIGAHSRNGCYCGKTISITQAECVCVCVLPYLSSMQSACAVLYCHLLSVWPYHIFPHFLINGTIFGHTLLNTKYILFTHQQMHFLLNLGKFKFT